MRNKFLVVFLFLTTIAFAQYGYRDSNMIGITLGLNQFDLKTSDFETTPGQGWNVGLSMRGNFYNDWDAIYAIQFSENNFKAVTLNAALNERDVNFKLSSAQISFQFSYKFIENHLSVEFGPLVQISGKANIETTEENYLVKGTLITAKDLTQVNAFNFYPVAGITAGVRNVRLNVSYQYGVTNMLGNVEGNFKGTAGILNGNIIFYF
jgi:hypothetical protein